ncbi:MAG: ATP-binding protein, partial [Nitrospirota bacterium]|nr:ATP-binding protein [Nitrospirota bacterium]
RMASVLAHEIRNPLGSIKGFAQYLKEHSEKIDERTEKSINIIIDESKRLELLTEDLLIYARIDELRPEKIDVISLIRDVITPLPVKERGILIKFDMPERIMIVSDKEKLRQIIYNLIQNSIDAIGSKGQISLSVKKGDNSVEIALSDTGKGIERDELEKIFTPFYTTKVRGTGLGLAIIDKLIKVLGGSIRVESEPNQYTTFIMRVPDIKRVDTLSRGNDE